MILILFLCCLDLKGDHLFGIRTPINPYNFVKINAEGVSFMMGSPVGEMNRSKDEGGVDGFPVKVTFLKSFKIMATEVTQRHWFDVMGDNPSYFKEEKNCPDSHIVMKNDDDKEVKLCPDHPVEGVSWVQVQGFIVKLNKGLRGCYGTPRDFSGCFRLPTEAEWEFSARGGEDSAYYFGNDPGPLREDGEFFTSSDFSLVDNPNWLDRYGLYRENSNGQTHPVALKVENPFGLHDMHGNVWEWVVDSYKNVLTGGKNPLSLIPGLGGKVVRGGSFIDPARYLRCAERAYADPKLRFKHVGFRLVRSM